jgi:hypothetical protein
MYLAQEHSEKASATVSVLLSWLAKRSTLLVQDHVTTVHVSLFAVVLCCSAGGAVPQ